MTHEPTAASGQWSMFNSKLSSFLMNDSGLVRGSEPRYGLIDCLVLVQPVYWQMTIQMRRPVFVLRVAGQNRAYVLKERREPIDASLLDAVKGQMMKSRLLAIVIMTSFFVHAHSWGDLNDKYKTRGWLNGRYWNYLGSSNGEAAKMTYILGIMDGINISNGFAKDDEELVKLNRTMEGLIPIKVKQSIDGVFNNQSNENIPIYIVMILEMRKMKGELSLSQYEKSLEGVRNTYAE